MPANLMGNNVYLNKEPAWHNMGFVSDKPMGAVEASSVIESVFYEKRPISVMINGQLQDATGDYAIIRSATPTDPNEQLLGFVKKNYQILQPISICEQFDQWVSEPVETLGFLGKGEKLFLTWVLPSFDVRGDPINTYGFVASGYDGKFGASLYVVSVRVVCENTYNMAVSEGESNNGNENKGNNYKGKIWSGRHNSTQLSRDLGAWMEHVQQRALAQVNSASGMFNAMAAKAINEQSTLADLLFKIYPDPKSLPLDFPDKLRAEKQNKIDELKEKAERDRKIVESLFAGKGTEITADGFGLFNSVTEYENHVRVTKKPSDYSILFGNRANKMTYAANVILDWTKK